MCVCVCQIFYELKAIELEISLKFSTFDERVDNKRYRFIECALSFIFAIIFMRSLAPAGFYS